MHLWKQTLTVTRNSIQSISVLAQNEFMYPQREYPKKH